MDAADEGVLDHILVKDWQVRLGRLSEHEFLAF